MKRNFFVILIGLMELATFATPVTQLVVPPASATIETNWSITGTYYVNGIGYVNYNDIAVAFDGEDVYFQGMVLYCPNAWIKGTINESTVTFATGQFVGEYVVSDTTYDVYACGSTNGMDLDNIVFKYNALDNTFALQNGYIENSSAEVVSCFAYSRDIVLTRNMAVPTNLEVYDISNADATVSWWGETDKYNLRYRTMPIGNYLLWDFENNYEGWSTVDADGDGNKWDIIEPAQMSENYMAHSGDKVMMSRSWISSGALLPDNWLITPMVDLGGTLSFWVFDDGTYHERFGVYVSTTGKEIESFTQIGTDLRSKQPWTEYTFDLRDYNGQQGYIGIRHYHCSDQDFMYLDDFCLQYEDYVPPGEWIIVENVTSPYKIESLMPNTKYELQVQSTQIDATLQGLTDHNSKWSASMFFSTKDNNSDIRVVKNDITDTIHYYDISGRYVGTSLDDAPSGIYISSNGKKLVKTSNVR